jgi:hypothetical protein
VVGGDKGDHEGEDESDGEHGGREFEWAAEHTENTEEGAELLNFGGFSVFADRRYGLS